MKVLQHLDQISTVLNHYAFDKIKISKKLFLIVIDADAFETRAVIEYPKMFAKVYIEMTLKPHHIYRCGSIIAVIHELKRNVK